MGACLPKSPSCGEVQPNTKLFNVCCGGQVIIEHSQVDGTDGENECYAKRKDEGASEHVVLQYRET